MSRESRQNSLVLVGGTSKKLTKNKKQCIINSMNIEEAISEEIISIESNKLLEKYYPYYFKRFPRKLVQVKAKFMPYFTKAASMFCDRDGYNAEKLIEAFMMDGFKFPQQLPNEQVWKTYKDYLPALHNKKSESREVVEEIVNAAIAIKRVGGVKNWLASPINQKMVIEEKMPFSALLLSFSSAFIEFCDNECGDNFDFEYMRRYVAAQKSSDKIIKKIEEILGEDYYLFGKKFEEYLEKNHIVF